MPKVSIIMGVYNCAKTLRASIDSILAQTFTDWEFIICDDGSKDETFVILQEYGERYPEKFVILKNEKNCGLATSLNKCFQKSVGKYIARMDGDDISLAERIEIQIKFLEEHLEYDLVSCSFYVFDDSEVWGIRKLKEKPEKEDFLWTSPFCHACVVYRAGSLKSVGAYRCEKETLRCEDYDLFMRMYATGMKGYNIQKPLYKVYEGREAYARRKYRYRWDEAKVRFKGFKILNLLPDGIPYIIKPLVVGLIPWKIIEMVKKR